jgi:hypothetical protein
VLQSIGADAGGHGYHQRTGQPQRWSQRARHISHELRLDRQHHYLRAADRLGVVGSDANTEVPGQCQATGLQRFRNGYG